MGENNVRYTLKIIKAQCAHGVVFSFILISVSVCFQVLRILQAHITVEVTMIHSTNNHDEIYIGV